MQKNPRKFDKLFSRDAVAQHIAPAEPLMASSVRKAPADPTPPQRDLSLETETYRQLRDLIVRGKLPPGLTLVETELGIRLGVSRTPIRAALNRLQHERFVQTARVGNVLRASVTPLTADDMAELFAIVGALEGIAGEQAAKLPDEPRKELAWKMNEINRRLAVAVGSRPLDIVGAQDLHVQFHRSYVDAATGPRLLAQLDALQPHAERYERVYTTALIGEFGASLSEHDAIINAIESADHQSAAHLVAVNWRNGAARYRQVLEIVGEKGTWT